MKRIFFIFSILLLLVGCTPDYLIEELGIINTKGVDRVEENRLLSTFIYYQFDPEAKQLNELVSAKSMTWKGTVLEANLKTNNRLVSDKLETEVFGRSLAEEGIIPIVDTLFRSARTPDTTYFVVGEENAEELLTNLFKNGTGNVGNTLKNLVEYNIDQEIIMKCRLRDFRHLYYKTGIDPLLPIIKTENNTPVIQRIALFQDDRMIGDISTKELFFLKLAAEPYNAGKVELTLPLSPFEKFQVTADNKPSQNEIHVALSEIKSHNNIKLTSAEKLTYRVEAKVAARLIEVSEQLRIEEEKVLKELEKQIALQIEDEMQKVLTKLQELNTDPIGFGSIYQTQAKLTEDDWRQKYPDIKVDLHVSVNLLRFGTTE